MKIVRKVNDPQMISDLCSMYNRTFEGALLASPHEQVNYSKEELSRALSSEEYTTFIAIHEAKPVAFCLTTENISNIPWASAAYYKKLMAGRFHGRRLLYISVLAVEPRMQSTRTVLELLKEVTSFVDAGSYVVAYDYSESKNARLPALLKYVSGELCGSPKKRKILDKEVYEILY